MSRDEEFPLVISVNLPSHVKTDSLAELHNAAFWNSRPDALNWLAIKPKHCKGSSCIQGREICTDGCNEPPAEMACTAGEEPAPSMWRIVLAYLMGRDPF